MAVSSREDDGKMADQKFVFEEENAARHTGTGEESAWKSIANNPKIVLWTFYANREFFFFFSVRK